MMHHGTTIRRRHGARTACVAAALLVACQTRPAPPRAPVAPADACSGVAACRADCDAGRLTACYEVGGLYENGAGATQSYPDAARLYERACAGSIYLACNSLGVLRELGLGAEANLAEAARLYRVACDGGDGNGCANLARRHDEGVGVPRDPDLARALRQRACGLGARYACGAR